MPSRRAVPRARRRGPPSWPRRCSCWPPASRGHRRPAEPVGPTSPGAPAEPRPAGAARADAAAVGVGPAAARAAGEGPAAARAVSPDRSPPPPPPPVAPAARPGPTPVLRSPTPAQGPSPSIPTASPRSSTAGRASSGRPTAASSTPATPAITPASIPIPDVDGPIRRVTEFGAKGDDMTDDTSAFLAGIAAHRRACCWSPPGATSSPSSWPSRKSNFVLRGEGMGKSILFFPRPLQRGGPARHQLVLQRRLHHRGRHRPRPVLGTVTANLARGATELPLSATAGIEAGRLGAGDPDRQGGTLFRALYGGQTRATSARTAAPRCSASTRGSPRSAPTSITLERHLALAGGHPLDPAGARRARRPSARSASRSSPWRWPPSPTPATSTSAATTASITSGAHDSWVRNVQHPQRRARHQHLPQLLRHRHRRRARRQPQPRATIGHHGLNSARGADILFTRFDVRKKYVHDLTVDGYAIGTVWSKGKGVDLNMDHHGRAPYGTLWTDLDLGRGTPRLRQRRRRQPPAPHRRLHHGVERPRRRHRRPPAVQLGPLMNFVASAGGTGGPPAGRSRTSPPTSSASPTCTKPCSPAAAPPPPEAPTAAASILAPSARYPTAPRSGKRPRAAGRLLARLRFGPPRVRRPQSAAPHPRRPERPPSRTSQPRCRGRRRGRASSRRTRLSPGSALGLSIAPGHPRLSAGANGWG